MLIVLYASLLAKLSFSSVGRLIVIRYIVVGWPKKGVTSQITDVYERETLAATIVRLFLMKTRNVIQSRSLFLSLSLSHSFLYLQSMSIK